MSSDQNNGTKRMTSIARKLEWSFIGKKIGLFFGMDLLLFVLLFGGWLADQEYTRLGGIMPDCERDFVLAEEEAESTLSILLGGTWLANTHLKRVVYEVKCEKAEEQKDVNYDGVEGGVTGGNRDSEQAGFQVYIYEPFLIICNIVFFSFVIQMLSIALSLKWESRSIRQLLAPIDEIALKADELSRMTFSEDKYQEIEDAISHLELGETELLSLGDEDLQGIEAAMNNLLIRMRDAYRQQARFVNDASHELRTPIAVIEGYANMLSRWGREDEKVLDESIAAIQHESEHMKHLVEQLLFLARGDSGKMKLTIEQVSLNDLMQEVYEESLMIDEAHRYRFRSEDAEVFVQADAMLLKQAVRVLVDNAAKYTNEGDEIILGCGMEQDGKPYLQVQDTGIGMAGQDVEHMFERFYRADDARGYQGTGLGLSIAKWIIDKHRGHFEILSRTELGTRIRVYFYS